MADWPVNVAIIKSPINWIIIFLMVMFAILIAELFIKGLKPHCTCEDQ